MPSHRDRRRQARARATFRRDQDEAAALRIAASIARLPAAHPEMGYHFQCSPFATRLALQQRDPRPRTRCPHLRGDFSGVIVFARAHEPFHLRCEQCLRVAARRLMGTVEDRTCDSCRTIPAGGVRGGLVQIGPLLVSYGLCPNCYEADRREVAS